jgi:hypothetical protein
MRWVCAVGIPHAQRRALVRVPRAVDNRAHVEWSWRPDLQRTLYVAGYPVDRVLGRPELGFARSDLRVWSATVKAIATRSRRRPSGRVSAADRADPHAAVPRLDGARPEW